MKFIIAIIVMINFLITIKIQKLSDKIAYLKDQLSSLSNKDNEKL